jgi:lipopolysaccharide transport system ATP-binding protein
VLIVDEALSVGDGYFQKKCMDRLRVFVDGGGTLLFCSHAMYYVSAFCQRALWLRHGRVEGLGPVSDVVRDYENFLVAKSAHSAAAPTIAGAAAPSASSANTRSGMPARIVAASLVEPAAGLLYRHGDDWELEVEWEAVEPGLAFHLGVGVNRSDGVEVCSFATHVDGLPPLSGRSRYRLRLRIPALPLVKGEFTLYIFLLDEEGLHIYDQRVLPNAFTVHSPSYAFGLVQVEHAWDIDAARPSSVQKTVARG